MTEKSTETPLDPWHAVLPAALLDHKSTVYLLDRLHCFLVIVDCCAFALIQSMQFHEHFHQFEKRLTLEYYPGTALLLTWLGNCLTPPTGRNEIIEACDATERTNT